MNWDELQNSNKYPKDMCMSARIATEQAIERGRSKQRICDMEVVGMNEKEMQEKADDIENYASNHDTYSLYNLANELIEEVRGLRERNAQITQNYNKRVEKYYYLQQEVKRLRELRSNVAIAHQANLENLVKESQLYKDLYTKENTQNMVYKVALEEIDNLREIHMSMGCDEWEEAACFNKAEGIANKALEVDTNE